MDYTVETIENYGDLGKLFAVTVDGEQYRIAARSEDDIPEALQVALSPRDNQGYPTAAVDLVAYASQKRFEKETGGVEVNGAVINTSRDSQNMITGAYNYAQANPLKMVSFKATSGWVQLSASEVIAIGLAVGDHVQALFALEQSIADQIATGAITNVEQIDAAFSV